MHFCVGHCSTGCDIQPNITLSLPVIMLEMMSGRMTSFSIRMRISPGKPKYSLSSWDRDAYSLTTTPKPIPERSGGRSQIRKNSWFQLKTWTPGNLLCIRVNVPGRLLERTVRFHPQRIHCWFLFSISEPHMYSTQWFQLCTSNRYHTYRTSIKDACKTPRWHSNLCRGAMNSLMYKNGAYILWYLWMCSTWWNSPSFSLSHSAPICIAS